MQYPQDLQYSARIFIFPFAFNFQPKKYSRNYEKKKPDGFCQIGFEFKQLSSSLAPGKTGI